MTSVYKSTSGIKVFSKGAPDILIDMCTRFVNRNGQIEEITEDFLINLKDNQKKFANDSLRTLLITYKDT